MATDLKNISIAELKKIKRLNQQKLKKEYLRYKKKQKLIADIKKIKKQEKNIIPIPNLNLLKLKHLRTTFRSVSRIKQFPLILLLIFAKLLSELLRNMIEEL